MKKIYLLLFISFAGLSCTRNNTDFLNEDARALILDLSGTRAAAVNYDVTDYFSLEDLAAATVNVKYGTKEYEDSYIYSAGKLLPYTEVRTLWFPYEGNIDKLTVYWPELEKRSSLSKDQRSRSIFLSTDWLKCEMSNVKQSPSVAISMDHERAKISFTLGGNLEGEKILYLKIGDYMAYIDPSDAVIDAQLILDAEHLGDVSVGTIGEVAAAGYKYIFKLTEVPAFESGLNKNYSISINVE